jgi:Flp pilus assembly pilin Flp
MFYKFFKKQRKSQNLLEVILIIAVVSIVVCSVFDQASDALKLTFNSIMGALKGTNVSLNTT